MEREDALTVLSNHKQDLSAGSPLFARAAKDNAASIRVLEKCGFTIVGEDKGYANACGQEVAELVLRLDEHCGLGTEQREVVGLPHR